MNKKIIYVILVLILAVAAVIFWYSSDRIVINEFAGNVVGVNESSITAQGTYIKDGIPVVQNNQDLVEVEISVDTNTRITRESFDIPENEEIFNPDELPKEVRQVGLDQMRLDAGITVVGLIVRATGNIYGQKKFQALEITYRVPNFPDRLTNE